MSSTSKIHSPLESSFSSIFPTQKQIINLLDLSQPITVPFIDLQKRIIQLWKYKTSIFASIEDISGYLQIIPGSRIHNAI